MRRFIKRLLCGHPFMVRLERNHASRSTTVNSIVCVRCGRSW